MAGLEDFTSALGDFGTPDFGAGGAIQLAPPTALETFSSGVTDVGRRVGDFAGKVGAGIGKEFTDSPLASFTKTLGLGTAGLNIANQRNVAGSLDRQTRTIEQGQKQAQAAAAPAVAFGTTQLNAAAAGQLPKPMEDTVQAWIARSKADMRARFAQMGEGNSTNIEGEDAKIEAMAQEMRATMLQQQESTGLEALQTGVSAGTGTAATAQNQQKMLTDLLAGADQQLAQMTARAA